MRSFFTTHGFRTIKAIALSLAILPVLPACNNSGTEQKTPGAPAFGDISAQEAVAMIQERDGDDNFVIIDVRTPEEFGVEHLEDAVNIDYNGPDFLDEIDRLDRQKTYLVYCGSGARSSQAVEIMRQLGFVAVYNVLGGMSDINQVEDAPVVSCGCP